MDKITKELEKYYSETFTKHGATSKGVDWGPQPNADLRYQVMFDVINQDHKKNDRPSVLDVGCGYGGMLSYAQLNNIDIDYTGIDVVAGMIKHAELNFSDGKFVCSSLEEFPSDTKYDYVICNGILTQKLSASILDMDVFFRETISNMFELCNRGIAFNTMKTRVDFIKEGNYHKNPLETMSEALKLSGHVKINHAYPLYEYTTYIYKD